MHPDVISVPKNGLPQISLSPYCFDGRAVPFASHMNYSTEVGLSRPILPSLRIFLVAALFLVLQGGLQMSLHGQSQTTGNIEGRVYDPARGQYLERARMTIEGTNVEAFTDVEGTFRFIGVSAGVVRVRAFFTGLAPQTATISVIAGETVKQDFTLAAPDTRQRIGGEDVVQLDSFVIRADKDLDGAAIAIQEQRFASNIINVVASDEFNTVVDGTPGEVLKFLPGINLDYSAGEARTVSMNGVPSVNVPITIAGFDLASAAGNGTSRVVNLDQVSVNSIARIEVHQSPTPESPGSALAGTVNMVPRSAFERSTPLYTFSAFLMMKDGERSLARTPGPIDGQRSYKITPAANFSATVPVNKRFGFTLTGNVTPHQYSYENIIQRGYRGVNLATTTQSGTAVPALPPTTPDKPYLTDVTIFDSTRDNNTTSVGLTMDFRLARNDVLSLSTQYTFIDVMHNSRRLYFYITRVAPGDWGPTFTRGANGQGEIRIEGNAQDWAGDTLANSLIWRHNGPLWKAQLAAGYSRAALFVRDAEKGLFGVTRARRTGVTVNYFNVSPILSPNSIAVADSTGRSVDPYSLDSYALNYVDDHPKDSYDVKKSIFGNLARDFDVWGVPILIKGGFDIKGSSRDLIARTKAWNFVGRDRSGTTNPTGTSDDGAGILLDETMSQRPGPFGFPKIPWMDSYKFYDLYRSHPEYFTTNDDTTYKFLVNNSKYVEEIISAAYLRFDTALFRRRLQLVGGLRGEQTNVSGKGPLNDPTRNFQRDANGKVLLGENNQPLLIVPTTNALGVSQLTMVERGTRTKKEYLRLFPSLNTNYLIKDNLIARASYYHSVGRPDFNQYVGGLTLPNTQNEASTSNRITVNNAGIKAWQAKTVKVRLEYYFERVGQVSIGAFRRDIKNFFATEPFIPGPEFFALYGLDPEMYGQYEASTQRNLPGTVRMEGLEFDYKQALTFLPDWARGLQVFANTSLLRAEGEQAAGNFSYVPQSVNWGASLTRPKYRLQLNWNYRGKQRRSMVAVANSITPGTYTYSTKRLYTDITAEYYFTRRFSLFANMRNILHTPEDTEIYNDYTPAYARFRQRTDYGSAWTIGVKGSL